MRASFDWRLARGARRLRAARPGTDASRRGRDQAAATATQLYHIVFLGDSLTAGLGLLSEEAYPVLMQQSSRRGVRQRRGRQRRRQRRHDGRRAARVDGLLEPAAKILVVALGGNDALRGLR